ncbi:MAG: hypothetical protein ACK4GL_03985 [Flavobacteriales bacterium]
MRTLSLKLDESIYKETEELLNQIKKPRNRYINEALLYYNKVQNRKILANSLIAEFKIVSEESMKILAEFDIFDKHEE